MNKLYLKFIIISLFLGILILTAFPFLFLFAPQQGRDFYYRELTYKHIASTNVGNVKDKYEILLSLFNYVKGNQNVDPNYKSEDKTAYNNLVLGVSWCDQQAFLLATLLNEYGINSRFRDVQHHTTLEVYINNQWKLIDPFFGQLFYRKIDGQLATLNDIIDNNGANITVNNFESSKPYIKDMGNIIPSKLYIPSEVRWKNGIGPDFIQILSESKIRKGIEDIADLSYDLLGKSYAFWFQNNYLKKVNVADEGPNVIINYNEAYARNDESYKLYFIARNYQIFGQDNKAKNEYNKLVTEYPESYWAKESIKKIVLLNGVLKNS